MKRPYVISGCIILAGTITAAANPFYNKSIVLHHHNSGQTAITIEEGMSTTFADGNLLMSHTKDGVTYEIRQPLSGISRWTFSDSEGDSGLWETAGIEAAGNRTEIRIDGNMLHVGVAIHNAPVKIYSSDGILVASGDGSCSFDLSPFPGGFYMIAVSGKTFKIAVK